MRLRWVLTMAFLPIAARADQFESIEGKALLQATRGPGAKAVDRLTIADLGAIPAVLKDARSSLLVVVTSKGNVARLLVAPELRKPAEGGGPPFPVFVLERFDTFDAADLSLRLARGREIVLFPGFQVDLDTGQVVPEGQGGDLGFDAKGTPALAAVKGARLFTLNRAPAPDPAKPPQPTPGRAVVPADFAGRYRLFGNGQWSGTLDLTVEGNGEVAGRFRSDTHGASYPVTGQVAADVPNKVALTVKFPRSHGEFEGFLWTEGKGALAGTFRLLDRTFGFFAVREGGRFAPEAADLGGLPKAIAEPSWVVLRVEGAKITYLGKVYAAKDLGDVLKARPAPDASPITLIRATPATSFADLRLAIDAAESAGLRSFRFSAEPER